MLCRNCGNQLYNNTVCPHCGAVQIQENINNLNNYNNSNNNKKENKNILVIIAIVVIAIAILLLYIFVFKGKGDSVVKDSNDKKADYYVYYSDLTNDYFLSDIYSGNNEPVDTYKCDKKCYIDKHYSHESFNLGNNYSFILDGKNLVYIDKINPKGFTKVAPSKQYEIKKIDATMYKYTIDGYNYYAILSTKNNVFGVTYLYSVLNENYVFTHLYTMDEDSEILYSIGISESGLADNLIYISYDDENVKNKNIIYNISTNTEESKCEGFIGLGGSAVLKKEGFIVLSSYHNENPYVSIYTKDYKLIKDNIKATQIEIKDNKLIIDYSKTKRIYNNEGEQLQ